MNAPLSDSERNAIAIAHNYLLTFAGWHSNQDQEIILAELLLDVWKQACIAQNERTRASALADEAVRKPNAARNVYSLGTRPPFNYQTLPGGEKSE